LAFLAESTEDTQTASVPFCEKPGDRIGHYKLLQKIGEGGCGVVYMAQQEAPVRRQVALKIIKLGMDTRNVIARFEAERQALALMDHPNIAKVFDAGATEQGRPFFVMELVRGIRITSYCDENQFSTRERLDLFVQVCQAIQHAHQKGIIHRDIKPSNILVTLRDGMPIPKVIDFGIAKATTDQLLTDKTVFTEYQQFLGTPAYMSPEQAEMSELGIDTRSDIYSLGILLYELLTGRTPFETNALSRVGVDEVRRIIREQEPARPSTRFSTMQEGERNTVARQRNADPPALLSLLRRDLDWIVMKCLQKDRGRRYETANGLAVDIERHLNHEPVAARPPSKLYRFQKLVRRNKFTVAAGASVGLALLLGGLASTWQAVRATRASALAQSETQRATAEAAHAKQAERVSEEQRQRAEANERTVRQHLYAADIKLAQVALEEENLDRALMLLERNRPKPGSEDLRGFEWRYLMAQSQDQSLLILRDPPDGLNEAAFSPTGEWLVTAGFGERLAVRDSASGKIVATLNWTRNDMPHQALVFSPDGKFLVGVTPDAAAVKVWSTEGWRELVSLYGHAGAAAFSPDSKFLAIRLLSGVVALWDTQNWSRIRSQQLEHGLLGSFNLAFTPDGKMLITASEDQVHLWDFPALEARTSFLGNISHPNAIAISPSGEMLAACSWEGGLKIWSLKSGIELASVEHAHQGMAFTVAFSTDGKCLASGGVDQAIHLWDASSLGNGSGGLNKTGHLLGHRSEVWKVAFSRQGGVLASASKDGTVRLWAVGPSAEQSKLDAAWQPVCFSEDAESLLALDRTKQLQSWDCKTKRLNQTINLGVEAGGMSAWSVALDGRIFAVGASNGTVRIWNVETKRCLATTQPEHDQINFITLAPNAGRLAFIAERNLWMWDYTKTKAELVYTDAARGSARFSPDGRLLASLSRNRTIRLRTVATGEELPPLNLADPHHLLTFSPDGKLLAIAQARSPHEATLWDLAARKPIRRLRGHLAGVASLCFSPDGKTLVTGSGDHTVRFWHVATGQEMLTLKDFGEQVFNVLFSRDETMLATGGALWTQGPEPVRLWRAPPMTEIDGMLHASARER
jgi:WD40 repeat protein/serine/threonine protein kinase